MLVERGAGDAARRAELGDRDPVETAGGEELGRGVEDLLAPAAVRSVWVTTPKVSGSLTPPGSPWSGGAAILDRLAAHVEAPDRRDTARAPAPERAGLAEDQDPVAERHQRRDRPDLRGRCQLCSASVSTLPNTTSGVRSAALSKTGANCWHGPHQDAQKSTSTMSLSATVCSKCRGQLGGRSRRTGRFGGRIVPRQGSGAVEPTTWSRGERPAIGGTVTGSSGAGNDRRTWQGRPPTMRELVDDLRARLARVRQGGSESARKKHTDRGKLLVRDRVDRLLDPGSPFLELSPLAAYGMYGSGPDDDYAVPSAGVVAGIGRVSRPRVRDRRQRRDRQGRHLLPDDGQEAPARADHRRGEPPAVHLPRRLRRRVPADAGRGLPRPRALRPDLLQPGQPLRRRASRRSPA